MSEILPSNTVIALLWDGLTYFEHQVRGIQWMLELERKGHLCSKFGPVRFPVRVHGGLLADEMGAGKTITTLATIAEHPVPHTLIVVPKAVIKNWTDNALRAGFCVYNIYGTGGSARWCQVEPGKATRTIAVYICGYSSLIYKPHLTVTSTESSNSSSSASASATAHWDRVVFDEAHVFRNYRTKLYKEVMDLVKGVKYRWVVTATPNVNSKTEPKDAVSLLAVLGVPATKGRDWNDVYYRPLVPALVLHRSMDSLRAVVAEMPAKPDIHDVSLPFTCEQEHEYYLMLMLLTKKVERLFRQRRVAKGLALLYYLRLGSLSPGLMPEDFVDKYGVGEWPAGKPSSKMLEIRRLVQAEPTKKFLVFCWFHKEMALIDAMLELEGITVEQYHGGMSETHRNAVLDRARKPECQVLLVQIRSGGVGLNLQEFNRVIFTSPYWTAAMMDQAIGRAVRIGQKEVVQVYHLLMETDVGRNIDTMTTNIAEAKRAMGEAFFAMADGMDPDAEPDYDDDPDADSDADADSGPEPETHMTRMEALELLGVKNSSDQEAIGKAYRELVLKWHPDKNPGKEAEVTPMFCRVRKAYELLTA
jgi:hypothetical protein